MNELSVVSPAPKRKRYTKAFKHNVITACAQPGASVARIALEVALATGDSARIEAAQSRLRTWTQSPFVGGDRCASAALASVADPGAPPLGALLDDDSPCHRNAISFGVVCSATGNGWSLKYVCSPCPFCALYNILKYRGTTTLNTTTHQSP